MNGIFTEAESTRLSVEERIHYLRVGLCAPVSGAELQALIEELSASARVTELEDELELARDAQAVADSEMEELETCIKKFMEYLSGSVTIGDAREKAQELFG